MYVEAPSEQSSCEVDLKGIVLRFSSLRLKEVDGHLVISIMGDRHDKITIGTIHHGPDDVLIRTSHALLQGVVSWLLWRANVPLT